MKTLSHKIAAFLMAFVVLFSTMSFTIDMHYCGDTLVDAAVFNKVKDCGMLSDNASSSPKMSFTKTTCCSNQQIMIDGQQDLQTSTQKNTLEQQIIAVVFFISEQQISNETTSFVPFQNNYSPPVSKGIYKLYQVYLI